MFGKHKQKQKRRDEDRSGGNEFEVMKFLEFNISDFLWCKACKRVYTSEEWILNDFNCLSKGCHAERKIIIPWSLIKSDSKNKSLPDKPEIGKFYHPHT